jgi:signal transduction histidine kinase
MRLVDRVVAGVLHEIRSPVDVLSTNSELLEHAVAQTRKVFAVGAHKPAKADADNVLGILESIHESQRAACDRILDTVRSVEAFLSPIPSPSLGEPAIVELSRLVDGAVELLCNVPERPIEIRRDYRGAPSIEGSPNALKYLFMNLLLDAMDATGADGIVTISLGSVEDDVTVGFHYAGPQRSHAGEAGGDSSTVGVVASQHIVSQHHGRLEIESSPSGRTITVHLPRRLS